MWKILCKSAQYFLKSIRTLVWYDKYVGYTVKTYCFSYQERKIMVHLVGLYPLIYKCTHGWDKWNIKNISQMVCLKVIILHPNYTVQIIPDCHHQLIFITVKNMFVKLTWLLNNIYLDNHYHVCIIFRLFNWGHTCIKLDHW